MGDKRGNTTEPVAPAVKFSEEWLRGLIEQTLAGIYLIQNGYFRYVNQGFADIFGYASPVDLIDTVTIGELIAPEDRQKVAENVRRRTEEDVQEMRYTFVGLRKDGRRIDVEVHGRSMEYRGQAAVIGLILDITERRQAEAARLAEAAIRVTAMVFEAQEGMVVTDASRVILRANRAFAECTGYAVEEALGRPVRSLFHSGRLDEGFFDAVWVAVARSGSWQGEIWSQRKHGEEYPGWMTIAAVRGSDGVLTHYVVTLSDITERKRLESEMTRRIEELRLLNERLEEANTQLLQAEKLMAVGQLAAGIAHEINNPVGFVTSNLGSLQNYVGGLLRVVDAYRRLAATLSPSLPERVEAERACAEIDLDFVREDALPLLDESKKGLDRVSRIVADLKNFSRVGESLWQRADVHKSLDSTLNVVASEIRQKASVVRDYGVLPEIRCMPFQLNEVFMNLLLNAAQAVHEPGTITLRTGCEGENVWVEVEDNGVGIPPENLKRLFEPFFTTKPVGSGTGLGLSVSYGIVQRHGGRIEVRSTPGRGSVFRVVLPVEPAGAEGGEAD